MPHTGLIVITSRVITSPTVVPIALWYSRASCSPSSKNGSTRALAPPRLTKNEVAFADDADEPPVVVDDRQPAHAVLHHQPRGLWMGV